MVNLVDLLDYFTSKFLYPIAVFCVALFVGLYMKKADVKQELMDSKESVWFSVYMFLIRYFVPIAFFFVFLIDLGLFSFFTRV